MAPIVSILILTHNRVEITMECVTRTGYAAEGIAHEILIWDNFSNDGTFDFLCEYQKLNDNVVFVNSSEYNYGVEAINFLAEQAKGKYLIKIDDDIIPPPGFVQHMVQAYEEAKEEKLAFISWDMPWNENSFALRSGKKLYNSPKGKTLFLNGPNILYISYHPDKWLANGACRFSSRDKFFEIGGHPKGIRYGVDAMVSKAAALKGYYIGYISGPCLLEHKGRFDSPALRKFKNDELKRYGNPLHV